MNVDRSTCEQPNERADGTLCGFPAESVVDVVRYEDDGSATFFTLPLCLGHRLALGEHVVHFEAVPAAPCGSCGGTGQFTDDRGVAYEDACPDCDPQP